MTQKTTKTMKFLMICVALVAVIGCANSAPVSDELMDSIVASIHDMLRYFAKSPITTNLKNLLEAAHDHFPSLLVLDEEPEDSEKMNLFRKEMFKLDRKDCDDIMRYNMQLDKYVKFPEQGDMTDEEWEDLEIAETNKDSAAKEAMEITILCGFFQHDFEFNELWRQSLQKNVTL